MHFFSYLYTLQTAGHFCSKISFEVDGIGIRKIKLSANCHGIDFGFFTASRNHERRAMYSIKNGTGKVN